MNDNNYGIDFSDLDLDWLETVDRSRTKRAAKPSAEKKRSSPQPSVQEPVKGPASAEPAAAQPTARAASAAPSGEPTAVRSSYERDRAAASRGSVVRETPDVRQTAVRRAEPERTSTGRSTPPPDDRYSGRRRRGRGGGAVLIVLIVVLLLGMAFAGWQLTSIFRNYKRDRSAYEDIASHAIQPIAEQEEEPEEQPETSSDGNGGFVSEIPLSVDWEYLRSINSDIVGWLYCPDTVINYPVVQTSDQTFYLDHGFDRNANKAGTLFADPSSVAGINQSNFIVYGHNMKDESMFGSFKNYVNKSYYEEHPVMYYLTPAGSYRIDLICAHVAESLVENLPGYFSSLTGYQSYLNSITSDAFWVDHSAVTTDLQLFSMSTCTSAVGIDDARLIVFGMMVPIQ